MLQGRSFPCVAVKLLLYIFCFHLLPQLTSTLIIQRQPPELLLGILTTPLSPHILRNRLNQFRLGAFEQYAPLARLIVDSTRFLGFSPEQVRTALDAMGKKEPFIILDERTSADGSIWYINRYVDEVLEDKEVLEEWLKHDAINVKAGERILLKSRRKMIDVPTFFEAIHEGQTDILAELPQPYDPGNSSVPTQSLYNWEIDPPKPPAPFIVAAPDEFEVTRDPVETHKFVIPHRGYPDEVVRLKAGVARQQRLVAKWTLIMKKYEGGDSPRGSVVLQQEWDVGVVRAVDGDRVGVE